MENNNETAQEKKSSKWITMKLKPEEVSLYFGVKQSLHQAGLTLPMSQVMRKILDVGMEHINLEKLAQEPFYLFQLIEQGEPSR
tara:strand:- start:1045 stop:1296 length:252 start_codon:yes stop_codon:yes gene_type:complete